MLCRIGSNAAALGVPHRAVASQLAQDEPAGGGRRVELAGAGRLYGDEVLKVYDVGAPWCAGGKPLEDTMRHQALLSPPRASRSSGLGEG